MAENIWKNEILYRRCLKEHNSDNKIPPEAIFNFRKDKGIYENDLSVNWKKYCKTAEEARNKAKYNIHNKWVVSLISCDIINNCKSWLTNTPSWWFNRDKSHSSITPNEWINSLISNKHNYLIYKQWLARNSKREIKPWE